MTLLQLITKYHDGSNAATRQCSPAPSELFPDGMEAISRVLVGHGYMICDRDGKFSGRFKALLRDSGVAVIPTPYQAPNCNAFAERFIRSIKEECLDGMILFGEAHLRRAIAEYVEHYHRERPHQGLGNRVIDRTAGRRPRSGREVVCQERLGGLLRHYRWAA